MLDRTGRDGPSSQSWAGPRMPASPRQEERRDRVVGPTRSRLTACLVTGSPESGRCGIHDYTTALARALGRSGVSVEIIDQRDWSVSGTLGLARRLRGAKPDVVQLQYPMIVGWRSLGPQALGFLGRWPTVVTLHEYTTFDPLRRASLWAFAASARRIVMTTRCESERFLGQFPAARPKSSVIPIGSNLPFRPGRAARGEARRVVYFGQIKPLKGFESFLDLAEIAAARGLPWRFAVVGAPVGWARPYLDAMRARTASLALDWILDRGDDETADILAGADAAYLPFPDGASERRGSLVAALGNGLPVVTTDGPDRPADMDGAVLFARSPAGACARLEALFADAALEQRLRAAGPAYVRRFDWDAIGARYAELYRQVAGKTMPVGMPA